MTQETPDLSGSFVWVSLLKSSNKDETRGGCHLFHKRQNVSEHLKNSSLFNNKSKTKIKYSVDKFHAAFNVAAPIKTSRVVFEKLLF